MNGLADRVAIVTGGAAGIGRATALRLAEEGTTVVIADVDETGGLETVERIESIGGEAAFVRTDVSDPSAVEAMVDATLEEYGRLDFAHNNAGFDVENEPLAEQSVDYWNDVVGVYLTGVWLGMKYEIPAMRESDGGAIVNTSSGAGVLARPWQSAYTASKHGVIGLTRSAAFEYATDDIRVNAVCPGPIRTEKLRRYEREDPDQIEKFRDMVPMARFGEPEEVASVVACLFAEETSYVTGQALGVDGGVLSALPGDW